MSLLSWNYHGLGNQLIVNVLEAPNIVFLMETKSDIEWMKKVWGKCDFKHGLIVPSNGSSGRLALLWKGLWFINKLIPCRILIAFVDGGDVLRML